MVARLEDGEVSVVRKHECVRRVVIRRRGGLSRPTLDLESCGTCVVERVDDRPDVLVAVNERHGVFVVVVGTVEAPATLRVAEKPEVLPLLPQFALDRVREVIRQSASLVAPEYFHDLLRPRMTVENLHSGFDGDRTVHADALGRHIFELIRLPVHVQAVPADVSIVEVALDPQDVVQALIEVPLQVAVSVRARCARNEVPEHAEPPAAGVLEDHIVVERLVVVKEPL